MSNLVTLKKDSAAYKTFQSAILSSELLYQMVRTEMHQPVINGKLRKDSGRIVGLPAGDDERIIIPEYLIKEIRDFFESGAPSKHVAMLDDLIIFSGKCSKMNAQCVA